jgi:hypothetical protein
VHACRLQQHPHQLRAEQSSAMVLSTSSSKGWALTTLPRPTLMLTTAPAPRAHPTTPLGNNQVKPRFNIFFKYSSTFIYLHDVSPSYFPMFILQTIFIHVYRLKDDTIMPKANPRTVMLTLECFQRWSVSGFSLHVHERPPSALWVAGSGSLATPFPIRTRAPRSSSRLTG